MKVVGAVMVLDGKSIRFYLSRTMMSGAGGMYPLREARGDAGDSRPANGDGRRTVRSKDVPLGQAASIPVVGHARYFREQL